MYFVSVGKMRLRKRLTHLHSNDFLSNKHFQQEHFDSATHCILFSKG